MTKLNKVPGYKIAQMGEIPFDESYVPATEQVDFSGEPLTVNGISGGPAQLDTGIPPVYDETPVAPNGLPESVIKQEQMDKIKTAMSNQDPMQQYISMMNSPEKMAQRKQLIDLANKAAEQQQRGLLQNEQALNQYQNQKGRVDLSPLMGLSDSLFGSKLAQSYVPPESPEARQEKILALRNAIQTQRQGLTAQQIALLKSQMADPAITQMLGLARLNQGQQRTGLREDAQAAQAVKDIDNHPLMQNSEKQLGFIQRDMDTINSGVKITPQILHELSNGIANALSGGRGVGLGMTNLQDMSTAQTALAKWEQYITNHPEEGASPEVKAQLIDTLNRLQNAYGIYRSGLAERLSQGRTYEHNPQAQRSLKTTIEKYKYTPSNPIKKDVNSMSDEELTKAYNKKMGIQ